MSTKLREHDQSNDIQIVQGHRPLLQSKYKNCLLNYKSYDEDDEDDGLLSDLIKQRKTSVLEPAYQRLEKTLKNTVTYNVPPRSAEKYKHASLLPNALE